MLESVLYHFLLEIVCIFCVLVLCVLQKWEKYFICPEGKIFGMHIRYVKIKRAMASVWLTIKHSASQECFTKNFFVKKQIPLFTKERNNWIINMSWGIPWIKASNSNFHYRSPREGNDKLLQYSCLKNFMDRGVWQAKVHVIAKESYTTEWLTQA